jgi:secreted Zn-dependent insulinase-like peptidase
MTNRDLVERKNVIEKAINQNVFQSTKIKYALTSNAKRLERALESYQEEMQSLRSEFEDELRTLQRKQEDLQERRQEIVANMEGEDMRNAIEELRQEAEDLEAPQIFREKREELLDIEVDNFTPYNVSDSYLDKESGVDAEFLYMLDWMFSEA